MMIIVPEPIDITSENGFIMLGEGVGVVGGVTEVVVEFAIGLVGVVAGSTA